MSKNITIGSEKIQEAAEKLYRSYGPEVQDRVDIERFASVVAAELEYWIEMALSHPEQYDKRGYPFYFVRESCGK